MAGFTGWTGWFGNSCILLILLILSKRVWSLLIARGRLARLPSASNESTEAANPEDITHCGLFTPIPRLPARNLGHPPRWLQPLGSDRRRIKNDGFFRLAKHDQWNQGPTP